MEISSEDHKARVKKKGLAFRLAFFSRMMLVLTLVSFVLSLSACGWNGEDANDLARADLAMRQSEYGDAEMFYERYLRKNPNGDQRWQVWKRLVDLTLNIRQDNPMAMDYLEIMLVEFDKDADRRREIQIKLADLCHEARRHARSVQLWEALARDEGLEPNKKAEICRNLAKAYLRHFEFTMAKDTLKLCLALEATFELKAGCMYELAEVQMLTNELEESQITLRSLLQQANIPEAQRVLAVFMLADVLEQLEQFEESKQFFETIRKTYPNPRVVELRLSYLQKREAKKK